MENFGQVRQLAAAVAGQVAATRPPVLSHWVAEDRLIGQTGKTVRPNYLISVGTSGADPVYRRHHGCGYDRGHQPGSCRSYLSSGGHRCGCRCSNISAFLIFPDQASGHAPIGR
jgi:hypothetical protein